jgi:membrane-associated phospholipid phosphatase
MIRFLQGTRLMLFWCNGFGYQYGDQSVWYTIGGYTVATATGTFRMLNNRHWLSDVLVGAGIGILSAKASYIIYPWIKNRLLKITFQRIVCSSV